MNIIQNAAILAAQYHREQKRKHSGRPFETHCIRVGGRAATRPELTDSDVAGAFLHDVIEDQAPTPARYEEIRDEIIAQCGKETFDVVLDLTNKSKSLADRSQVPRAERKRIDRIHIKGIGRNSKIIKLIDRIDNLNECIIDVSMGVDKNLDFNLLFADESELLLASALSGTDLGLEAELMQVILKLREVCAKLKTA